MSGRHILALMLALTAAVGCSGSSGGTTASPPATATSSPTTPSASPTPVPLTSGAHDVDISWRPNPNPGVPCPKGEHGYCTAVRGGGTDATLGELFLSETLATPSNDSCSTGDVVGTFGPLDDPKSVVHYTGTGKFCWDTTTGTFHLKLGKGTGEFKGVKGTLTAKITDSGALADEWKGTLNIKA